MANINTKTMTRMCIKCNKELTLDKFGLAIGKNNIENSTKNINILYKSTCKECSKKILYEWRKNNKDYWKKYQGPNKNKSTSEKYGKENLMIISMLRGRLSEAKLRAKKRKKSLAQLDGIDLDFLWEQYKKQNGKCYLTGYDLAIEKKTPYTLSLDRIDSSKPYSKDNVMLCCFAANRAKGDLPLNEFLKMCSDILNQFNDYRKHSKYSNIFMNK